jgi:hypothetical protein
MSVNETARHLLALVLLLCVCAPGVSVAQGPTQAYIRAGEHGQALLLSRLGACYAVTPAHVMGDDLFATLVGASLAAPQGDADLLQAFGYDLALLRTTGAITAQCGGRLRDIPQLDSVLARASTGVVSSVNPDGSVTRRNVTINDVGLVNVRLRPRNESDQLFKGLSGSLVLAGEQPIGILMRVDPESGEGTALRYDRALETLRPFFAAPGATAAKPEAAAPSASGHEAGLAAEVASWSSPPLDAAHRAANLVDASDEPTVWLARADAFPIEIVIALPGERAHAVNAVRLVGEGVDPADRLPKDFEVLVRGGGGWISVASATYFRNDADRLVQFAPTRAREIMLRVYSNWGDADAVGLSGFEVQEMR